MQTANCKLQQQTANKNVPHMSGSLQLRDGRRWHSVDAMQLYIIFILVCALCQQLQCIQLGELPTATDLQLQQKLLQLLQRIRREQDYDTLVIYGQAPCVFHELLQQLELPTVLFTEGSSLSDWNFSSESLLLCCDSKAEQEHNPRSLSKLQVARRLVYLESQKPPQSLCEDYFQREQPNVVMWNEEGNLYSCRYFPQLHHVQQDINSTDPLYVQQFQNMHGAVIRSEPDQLSPRSMLYHHPVTGKLEMLGFVANLVNTFVRRVNATLQLPPNLELGRVSYYADIEHRTLEGKMDIAAALTTTLEAVDLNHLSYPYASTTYCFMLPMPADVPYHQIYAIIVDPLVLSIIGILFVIFSLLLIYSRELSWRQLSLTNVLLNDRCLRGLLGQPFPLPANPSRHLKAICMLLCFAALMTTTMYESFLQSFFTSPPPEELLRSFADYRNSPYKIAVERNEVNLLVRNENVSLSNAKNVYVLDDWNEFIKMRDAFNNSYIYPVTELRWRTYAEQQKPFKEQIFYYSEDNCLNRFVVLCIPVRQHLPYRQLFEQHILFMQAFGMKQLWLSRSFFDMVSLKLATLQDYSNPKSREEPVFLQDLSNIFEFYAAAHLLACICFAFEYGRGRYLRNAANL